MAESRIIKLKAIVLRSVKYGEQDKMLSLLSEQGTLYSAAAKGAQSAKSRFKLSSQLFCASEFVLSVSRAGYYVQSADIIERFPDLCESLLKNAAACYLAELAHFAALGNEDEQLYRLLGHSLLALCGCEESFVLTCLTASVMRLCAILGIRPRLNGCAVCGKMNDKYYFDPDSGVLLCLSEKRAAFLTPLSDSEARYLNALTALSLSKLEEVFPPHPDTQKKLFLLAADYLARYFSRQPNSYSLLIKLI